MLILVVTGLSVGAAEPGDSTQAVLGMLQMPFEALLQLEVTTVTRTESTIGESAAAVAVITQEEIRRSGATTIAEVLRRVPGLTVARMDANKWAISARGFAERFGNKLLVQVDGRTVYNPVFTGVFWDVVDHPLEDIERIEVVRGPGASVWGANAVNGVINIITKSSRDTLGGLFVAGGGTEEHGFGALRYGGRLGSDLTYRVYGKGFHRDEQFFGGGDSHDQWWGTSGGLRLDWQPTPQDLLTLQGDYIHSDAGRRDVRPMTLPPFQFLNVEEETTQDSNILGRWTRQLGDGSSLMLQAYWEYFRRTSENGIQYLLYDLFDLDTQHQLRLGEHHRLTYGLGYRLIASERRASRDGGFTLGFDDTSRHTQLFSAFVQDEITLVTDKLSALLGSKFEHNDHSGFEVQPTARLLWSPTARQRFWAAVSRAVRTPSIGEDNAVLTLLPFPGTSTFLQFQPSPDLVSEEVIAYELGYRVEPTKTLALDLALFYNDYGQLRSSFTRAPMAGPNGTTLIPVVFANELSGESYGVELAAKWQVTPAWQLYAAYSYLEMQLHRPANLAAAAEAAEGQSPQQQVFIQSSWNLTRNIELDLIGRFVDRLTGFNLGGAPGAADAIGRYCSLDARLAWRPNKHLELAIVGQNLLDERHPEFGTSPLIRAPEVERQRAVYGKVTWRF